ncbi:MAG TPA: diacylglycerol kinase family protein [Candidatus Saccharimonadales bacterium]|nr:diacylglycerol kinase family protein [Candidatus Saccharimonadales bacterium]
MAERFNHVVAVVNPNSTRADRAGSALVDLAHSDFGRNLVIVTTEDPKTGADNVSRIAESIKPDDVVISFGGDGSAFGVLNAIMLARESGIPKDQVSWLLFNGGNGNDQFHDFYGDTYDISKDGGPAGLLETGRLLDIDAIRVTKDLERLYTTYMGLGTTGLGAVFLEKQRGLRRALPWSHRALDEWLKLKTIIKKGQSDFSYTDLMAEGEDGELPHIKAQELTATTINRMSNGSVRFAETDKGMVVVKMSPEWFLYRGAIKKLLLENKKGGITGELKDRLLFILESDAPAHFSGETEVIPKGTVLEIKHMPQLVQVVAPSPLRIAA